MAKKKYTHNQTLYRKQVKRIKQAIKRLEKRGYKIDLKVSYDLPKRVTKKTISELKKITPKVIREKYSSYLDKTTGEIVSGTQGEAIEKQIKASQKEERKNKQKEGEKYDSSQGYLPNGGDIVLDNIIDDLISVLSTPAPSENSYGGRKKREIYEMAENCRMTLYNLLMNKIAECGRHEIGWRLEEHADDLESLKTAILYGSDEVVINTATRELAEIINGESLTFRELVDLHDEAEQSESYDYD